MTEGDDLAIELHLDGDDEADVKVQKGRVWINPKYCAYLAGLIVAALTAASGVLL